MTTVGHFIEYLAGLQPQNNTARLAFYNYFKNFFDPKMELTKALVESFYTQALFYQYWQENAEILGKTVESDLQAFSTLKSLSFNSQDVQHAHQTQVITIKNEENFKCFIQKYLKEKSKDQAKLSLIPFNEQEHLALILKHDGTLNVHSYPRLCLLKRGELQPIGPRMALEYTPQMELSTSKEQMIANSFNGFFRFRTQDFQVFGTQITGYTFNKTDIIKGSLNQTPDLFYALKKIERYFINPQSDPFYHELVALLEKTIQLIKAKHPDAELFAKQGLKKGQMALKNAFPNDRLLLLLTQQIEATLNPASLDSTPRP